MTLRVSPDIKSASSENVSDADENPALHFPLCTSKLLFRPFQESCVIYYFLYEPVSWKIDFKNLVLHNKTLSVRD